MLERLKELREKKNITVTQMSEMLGYKTAAAYWKKENGMSNINIAEAGKIAEILGCTVDDIFFNLKCSNMENTDKTAAGEVIAS